MQAGKFRASPISLSALVHWRTSRSTRARQAGRPNRSKQNQIKPNETKQNCLVSFGFIRPKQDFSMGYNESK
jgi:hypothetical protein